MGKEEVFGKLLKRADACVFSVNLWFIKDHLSVNRTRSKRKEAYQDPVGSCSSLHWTCLSSHNPIFSVQSFRAAPKSLLWSWTSGQERMLYLVCCRCNQMRLLPQSGPRRQYRSQTERRECIRCFGQCHLGSRQFQDSSCAVVKAGAEPLGDDFWVESQPGQWGALFSVSGTIKEDKDISSVVSFLLRF